MSALAKPSDRALMVFETRNIAQIEAYRIDLKSAYYERLVD